MAPPVIHVGPTPRVRVTPPAHLVPPRGHLVSPCLQEIGSQQQQFDGRFALAGAQTDNLQFVCSLEDSFMGV